MLVCKICGEVCTESEANVRVWNNEFNYYEKREICPTCHHEDLTEATKCKVCGEWFLDDEGTEVCGWCIDDETSVGTALKFGDDRREDVAINGAIFYLLSEDKINDILTKYVEEHFTDDSKEISDFCYEYKQDFAEWLIERKG
jgi:hypothetical protein